MELSNVEYLFEEIRKDIHLFSLEKQFSLLLHYYETFDTKEDAMRREYAIKQMKKDEKEKLIKDRVD